MKPFGSALFGLLALSALGLCGCGGNECDDYQADEVPQAKQDCAAKNGQWSDVEACVY